MPCDVQSGDSDWRFLDDGDHHLPDGRIGVHLDTDRYNEHSDGRLHHRHPQVIQEEVDAMSADPSQALGILSIDDAQSTHHHRRIVFIEFLVNRLADH